MNVEHIVPNSPSINRNVETPKLDRAERAAGIARLEFGGRNYPAEGYDGFVDRAPGESKLLRANRWRGAAT